ncbi:MAG: hypothetical protein MJZ37_05755 [Bacilli bacterium]|nr:hypothetical protein [Bacilli bacterium]
MYIHKRNKTKSKIKRAYCDLLLENTPLEITISEICKKSEINRSTFYEYYSCLDELIEQVIKDQVVAISKVNKSIYDRFYIENFTGPETVKKYMENFANNAVLIKLINSKESHRFKSLIIHLQCEYEIQKYHINDFEKRLQVIYRNSGILVILFRWIEKVKGYDTDTVSKLVYKQIVKTETL